jgi:hypothetical protein
MDVAPWLFGWDAILAIVTGVLALATIVVAFVTRGVASATADEVRAQNQPVLMPFAHESDEPINFSNDGIAIDVKNGGKGPAFEVTARLLPVSLAPEEWSKGIMPQGAIERLSFLLDEPEQEERYELLLDYSDLAERPHSTRLVIKRVARRANTEVRQVYAVQQVRTEPRHIIGITEHRPWDPRRWWVALSAKVRA